MRDHVRECTVKPTFIDQIAPKISVRYPAGSRQRSRCRIRATPPGRTERSSHPEAVERHDVDPVLGGVGEWTQVEHRAADEPVGKSITKQAKPPQIGRPDQAGGFDLDGGDSSVGTLDDDVSLDAIVGAEVADLKWLLRLADLLEDLAADERLQDPPESRQQCSVRTAVSTRPSISPLLNGQTGST
jgi:hypothetical protein